MKTYLNRWIKSRAGWNYFRGFMIILAFLFQEIGFTQTWSSLGTGVDGYVYASTVFNGQLIVAGEFSLAGSVSVHNIARWNGTSWDSLGPGLNGRVDALAVYNGELIAGGHFTKAGTLNLYYLGAWNGVSWSSHLGSMNNYINSLLVYGTTLIAGGGFTTAGDIPANHIAGYSSALWWFPLGSGIAGANNDVLTLVNYGGNLVAGGAFTLVDDINVEHIASWNGTSWSPVGSGIGGVVYSLAVFNTHLIAGGLFTTAGGSPANNIARWNGLTWNPMGAGTAGTYPYVLALRSYNGALYAGGLFTTAAGLTVNGIAKWNGSAWSAMNGGVWNPGPLVDGVYTLSQYNSDLIVGGTFFNAGSLSNVGNIAAWNEPVPTTLTIQGVTVTGGENICYNATQTITVAGNGTNFVVNNMGTATLIAGQNILFLDGSKVLAGGTLSGRITTNGQFCNTMLMPGSTSSVNVSEKEMVPEKDLVTVFPNPTTGMLSLDLRKISGPGQMTIEVRTMSGEPVRSIKRNIEPVFRFSLNGLPAGMYMVRTTTDHMTQTLKVIKQDP